ncbi:MAG TPA: ribosome recycling factor [Chloroflexota bacterium]|jgi:ribosome recycling factor|nr:ribosome recycling factor [Chloroflexota bacterium]
MIQDILDDGERRMRRAVEVLVQDLATVRTGRASPALVEQVPVDYYGTVTPLMQLATINALDARTLVITPYDRSAIGDMEKAIRKADLGLNPTNDGAVVRVLVPSLTEERRRDMVRVVHKKLEEHKVAVRNVRREMHDRLKALEKEKTASSDEVRRANERLQKITDRAIEEMEQLGSAKEAEVLAV